MRKDDTRPARKRAPGRWSGGLQQESRFLVGVTGEERALLDRAAAARGESRAEFVRSAALTKARRTLGRK